MSSSPPPPRPRWSPEPFAALAVARRHARPGLRRLLTWMVLRHALRLAIAGSASLLVGRAIMGPEPSAAGLLAVSASIIAAVLAGFFADRSLALLEADAATALRQVAAARLQAMPASVLRSLSPGAVTVALQRHPDAVAKLVIGHRAASCMMMVEPVVAAAALAFVSWQAALLMLALSPVMIVFFVLIGDTLQGRAGAQERAFGRLAGQFADRLRTLPTILAHHALAEEEAKLAGRLQAYGDRTISVLRIAFLNSGLIDVFASLSIAILAVFLGLGHLGLVAIPGFSGLALGQSLFILMVAPEFFAPFRRLSEQYHAKAEGLAAASALDAILEAAGPAPASLPSVDRALVGLRLPASGLVVVTGPSGSGKSTLLRRLAGVEAGWAPLLPGGRRLVWIATDSVVPPGTLAQAIGHGPTPRCATRIRLAAAQVGLFDDALLPGGLKTRIGPGGVNLSGGQRLRIAVTRALLADGVVVADEPTAKLDAVTAALVRRSLSRMAATRLVVVASHDRELVALADARIELAPIEPACLDPVAEAREEAA